MQQRQVDEMSIRVGRLFRFSLVLLALVVWLWWDLTQAHNAQRMAYRPFTGASDCSLKSPAATSVSIARSNDPALANPCSATDEAITYETISQMVRRAVTLAGGLTGIVRTGDTVLIKPNLVQQDSSGSGGVTDVRVVKALVYLIDEIDHGKISIVVGDGSPRPYTTFEKSSGTTQKVWKQLFDVSGYQTLKAEALASGINFRLSNLNGNSDTNPWPELDTVAVPGGGQADPQAGKYFVHKDVVHANVYISVPVMKIHKEPGFTCALKNQIGIAASTRYGFNKTTGVTQESRAHKLLHLTQAPYTWQDQEIVDLSAIAGIDFVLVDAISCLETDKSPSYTSDSCNINIKNRVKMNMVVAGVDPVAVDHVCCRIMGLNPDDIEHITLAERVGLGTNHPDSITIVGSSIDQVRRPFKKPQTWSGLYGQSNRIWMLKGPYTTSGVTDPMNHQFISNEASLAPTAGADGWSRPVYFAHDQIMLNDYYSAEGAGTGNVIAYAFTYVIAPAEQRAELWLGSDEAMSVYVNGQKCFAYSGIRTFAGTDCYKDTVSITLHKGINRLLIKALQTTGTFNFTVNICDAEPNTLFRGNRVWGLKFVSEPGSVDAVEAGEVPGAIALEQNYPNPFNPKTVVSCQLTVASKVRLIVYDMLGRKVATLLDGRKEAGSYEVAFDGTGLASGVYFYRLTAGEYSVTKKMVLLR
jgi:uncharacterized protein (DUF362 family)